MVSLRIILSVLFSIIVISVKAQYAEEIDFSSLNEYIEKSYTIDGIYYYYPYILKEHSIKKVIVKDGDNIISETEIDKQGNTVSYKTYDLKNKKLKVEIKADYSPSERVSERELIQVVRNDIEKNETMITKFGYEDDSNNYEIWVNGKLRDKGNMLYEMLAFASPLTSIESTVWNYDTNFHSLIFIYNHGTLGVVLSDLDFENHKDEEKINSGLLLRIRAIGDTALMYTIYAEGESRGNRAYKITLQTRNGYEIFIIDTREDKLLQHTIFDERFKILIDKTYFYNTKTELIDFIMIEDSAHKKSKQKFEYEYF